MVKFLKPFKTDQIRDKIITIKKKKKNKHITNTNNENNFKLGVINKIFIYIL